MLLTTKQGHSITCVCVCRSRLSAKARKRAENCLRAKTSGWNARQFIKTPKKAPKKPFGAMKSSPEMGKKRMPQLFAANAKTSCHLKTTKKHSLTHTNARSHMCGRIECATENGNGCHMLVCDALNRFIACTLFSWRMLIGPYTYQRTFVRCLRFIHFHVFGHLYCLLVASSPRFNRCPLQNCVEVK